MPLDRLWLPRLSAESERDLKEIIRWAARHFGAAQARRYRATIFSALRELESGPNIPGSRARDEILPGVRTLHVARHGQRGRHFLIYRASEPDIRILRILHDEMDLARHLPSAGERGEPGPRTEG